MSTINPGEELRNFLKELYPAQANSFVHKMDDDLKSEGELLELFYLSFMNYLIRRLVTMAEYFLREYDSEWKRKLRSHLKDSTKYRDRQIDRLVELLSMCLSSKNEHITEGDKNRVKKDAKSRGDNCHMCGKELNFTVANTQESVTVDHVWPQALGGLSSIHNLRPICSKCNSEVKRNYIDFSDYHFEEISLPSGRLFAEESKRWDKKHYEGAVWAKTNYSCALCDQPAHRVGELKVARLELDDCWHFLNLTAYCINHLPR